MEIVTALVVLSVAAGVRPADKVTCPHPILCPCGITGKDVKVCVEEEEKEDPCKRWSRCKTCQDGLDGCLECPEGLESSLCLKAVTGPEVLSRQKRQPYIYRPSGANAPPQYSQRQQEGGEACLNPGAISNGQLVYYPPPDTGGRRRPQIAPVDSDFPVLGILRYSCDTGYRLVGIDTLTCKYTGEWSSEPPICSGARRPCLNPGPFENGRTVYYPPLILGRMGQPLSTADEPEYSNGGLILYSCDSGFALQGSNALTCQDDGEWSEEPPVCRQANANQGSYCVEPGIDPNGSRNPPLPPNREGFPNGTMLEYFCNQGYELEGNMFIECSSGNWDSRTPTCKPDVPAGANEGSFCAEPGIDPNGSRDPPLPPDRRGFPDGTMLEYFCYQGYELEGDMLLQCSSGNWASRTPTCKPDVPGSGRGSFCADPGIDPNGSRDPPLPPSRRGFLDGAMLEYFCNQGYELEGDMILECSSGKWESRIPSCKPDTSGYFYATFYAELYRSYPSYYIECHSDSNAKKIRFSRVVNTGRGGGLPKNVTLSNSEKSAKMNFSSVEDWRDRLGAYRCGFEAEEGSENAVVPYQNGGLYFLDRSVVASVGDNVTLRLYTNWPSRSVVWSRNGRRAPSRFRGMEVSIRGTNANHDGIYSVRYDGDTFDMAFVRLSVRRCKANVFGDRCNQVCPSCYNGGICHDTLGMCVCREGFIGRNCEIPCPEGFRGANCSTACGDGNCKLRLYCQPDPYGCSCARGFKGEFCHEECDPGWYGAGCSEPCHCAEDGVCNRFTGACSEGCDPGWKGLSCQIRDQG